MATFRSNQKPPRFYYNPKTVVKPIEVQPRADIAVTRPLSTQRSFKTDMDITKPAAKRNN